MLPPDVQDAVVGSKMLVFEALLPPFTRTRPSASIAVPGQNMSCWVFETSIETVAPVNGSKIAVCVLPRFPPNVNSS